MPYKPKRPCAYPGCGRLAEREQYCAEHQKVLDKQYNKYERDPASNKRYGRKWKRIRNRFIKAHPICEECKKQGKLTPAEEVHHIHPLSKGGGNEMSKMAALLIMCVTVSVLFTLSTLLSVGLISGFSDASVPVQAVDDLSMVSYHVSVFGFMIITSVFKLFAVIECCFITAAIAAVSHNYLISYLSGVIFVAVNMIVSKISAVTMGQWKYLNIFSVSSANVFPARYRATELFGYSVSMSTIALLILLFLCIILFSIILKCYNIVSMNVKIQRTEKSEINKISPRKALSQSIYKFPKRMLSLYPNELYKCRWAYVLLVILLGLKILTSAQYYTSYLLPYLSFQARLPLPAARRTAHRPRA